MSPTPLPVGHLLAERFEIESVLGRGGFGIAYLARDPMRDDHVVVKELAPEGSVRLEEDLLDLRCGALTPQVLRQRFLEEARLLGKLNVQGILPVRASFSQNGTAYFVTEHIRGSETLDDLLRREGRLASDGALDIFMALLDVLEAVHDKGILHRDIKPSNILLGPSGQVFLIDFGAAREFLSDAVHTHTVMYTPGYAPPEQLSERARRGPPSDLFALCATAYHMLTGAPPPDVAERVSGLPLPLLQVPTLEPVVAAAILKGLSLVYGERPQSAADMRELLATTAPVGVARSLAELDETLLKMQQFSFPKRGCPHCNSPLEEARPLRKWQCPVCRQGVIRVRRIPERVCPVCRNGLLRELESSAICTECGRGVLESRKSGLLSRDRQVVCKVCETPGSSAPSQRTSARTARIMACRECGANFDIVPDGRWRQIEPKPKRDLEALYPDEWARVAAGLEPSSGNAECAACGSDYFFEADRLTLLDAHNDPHHFAEHYLGRSLHMETIRWLGVGKESPHPGLMCDDCGTELDQAGEYLRLVKSPNRTLARFEGQPMKLEDLHRIASGLPRVDQEKAIEDALVESIESAYLEGEIGFSENGLLAWKGDAVRLADGAKGVLMIDPQEISFGGMLRKWRAPTDSLVGASGAGEALSLQLSGERETTDFQLSPQALYLSLKSGERVLHLEAEDLASRLENSLRRFPQN